MPHWPRPAAPFSRPYPGRSNGHRELDRERGSRPAYVVPRAEPGVVGVGDAPADRQPEAYPERLGGDEGVEDRREQLLGDPAPGVRDLDKESGAAPLGQV